MRLSIIIPVYNADKFLAVCLDSLLDQEMSPIDYEIIIINDGSQDNSLSIANSYSNKHFNIKVFTKINGGVGSARNKGLSLAKGTYVYFIDPDDFLIQNVLNTILAQAEKNNLDILTFMSQPIKDSKLHRSLTNKSELELSTILNGIDYISKNNYKNEVWWYIIKTEFIKSTKIIFIEGRWMEDAILTAKLFLKANAMAFFSIDAHRHLIVEDSAMTNKEASHYINVIEDNRNAAIVFESIIEGLEQENVNPKCIKRLRIKQQSFVFFMMVRMLKSTMRIERVKKIMDEISNTNAYPINYFPGNDYKSFSYYILVKLFNSKGLFYLMFRLFNPIIKKTI